MFTEKCFIRKYSQELVNKLIEIGHNVMRFSEPRYIVCDKNDVYLTSLLPDKDIDEYICCDTNEELFLAIAALRDDTDYMQWFMIPHIKTVPIPGYCGQQGMNGYQRIITSVEYHKYDRQDSRISDIIKFEKEDGETILPRKLNSEELKLWFNHKIMHNPYKDNPNIKCYTTNIRE